MRNVSLGIGLFSFPPPPFWPQVRKDGCQPRRGMHPGTPAEEERGLKRRDWDVFLVCVVEKLYLCARDIIIIKVKQSEK